MSSLFVTGASGFIGGALLRQLDRSRFERIVCLSRAGIPEAAARSFHVLRGSLREVNAHSTELAGCDTIVHLAALTGKARPDEYLEANVEGTRILLEESRRAGVKRFLYVSSIAARFPDKTVYPYARSKELAEQLVARSGLRYLIVRSTIVVGAGGGAWKSLVSLARLPVPIVPGDGRARVQPIHVDDLVRCLLDVVYEDRFTGEIVEIGGPEIATFEDFLGTIRSVLRGRAPRRSLHVPLRPVIWTLALLEKPLYPVLPVTAGQLSAFCNDGTARPHPTTDRLAPDMKRIREMVELAARS